MDEKPLLKESIQRDPAVFAEVYQLLSASQATAGTQLESASATELDELFSALPISREGLSLDVLSAVDTGRSQLDVLFDDSALASDRWRLEAIVKDIGRPALPVVGDSWQDPSIASLKERLDAARPLLRGCLTAVGRLDGKARMKGSGWLLSEDVLVTNAHVAQTFVTHSADRLSFTFDEPVQFDNRDNLEVAEAHSARVIDLVRFRPEKLDVAVLRLQWLQRVEFSPLELDTTALENEWDVAAIGYPEDDGRDDSFARLRYFQRVFQIKRLSPGRVLHCDDELLFQHDCTTLGGSSGSPIINLQSGKVIGLHCAGKTGVANVAIKAEHLARVLK